MLKKTSHLPTKTKGRAPSSRSSRAPKKKNEKNPVDKPEKKEITGGETILTRHLFATSPVDRTDVASQALSQVETFMLYRGLEPRDSAEAILAALVVAVTNSSMDCLHRAPRCNDSLTARDLNLRHGHKGALVARDLLIALDSRRGQSPKGVTVGKVNVGSGGQAIVGNVDSGGRRETSATGAVPRGRTTSKAKR